MQQSFSTRLGLASISLIFTGLVAGIVLYLILLCQLPDVEPLKNIAMQAPMQIFTRDGHLMGEYGQKQRMPIELNEVPTLFLQALIVTEDQRFYEHNGVDVFGLARAAKHLLATGRKGQGASTITMQVARNFYLSREKTFSRKLREILLAIKIEHHLTKGEILNLYINKIYFGQRAYGVAAAARNYYGKPPNELTMAQLAMLAGLPQAPSRHNPVRNPTSAVKRRNHVLLRLKQERVISEQSYQQAITEPVTASLHRVQPDVPARYIDEYVRRQIVAHYGRKKAYTGGLKVVTTVESQAQRHAYQSLRAGLLRYDRLHGWHAKFHVPLLLSGARISRRLRALPHDEWLKPVWVTSVDEQSLRGVTLSGESVSWGSDHTDWARYRVTKGYRLGRPRSLKRLIHPGDIVYRYGNQLAQWPEVAGALVAIQPQSGAIIAMQGGFNARYQAFNHATQAWRQPGSALKPFIYSAALARGLTLASVINDAPIIVADSGENFLWRPDNDNHRFRGPTRLREGLIHSTNLVSIRLLRGIGVEYARRYLTRFGFYASRHPQSLSLALGSGETTPLQLTEGYAVFANQGIHVKPYIIESIWQGGVKIYQHVDNNPVPLRPLHERVISKEQAYLMHTALQDVVARGTARRAKRLKRDDIVGKTGTTNDKKDAWFAGYHPQLAASVWLGFDDNRSLHAYGAQAALPIWIDFMGQELPHLKRNPMPMPKQILRAWIDRHSGRLASQQEDAVLEYFRMNNIPHS